MFKFGQIEVASKNFHKQRQITDIFTIDVNKVVLSDKVPCNNGKNWRYIVGYQVDRETIIPLFIKTPKIIFCYGVSQYGKNSTYTMSFNVSETKEWVSHGKLKIWKERIKTNFHGQDVPYDMYCNATIVLKIVSVYKYGKNYHPQVYVGECKYTNAESRQCNMLSHDDDGFFKV